MEGRGSILKFLLGTSSLEYQNQKTGIHIHSHSSLAVISYNVYRNDHIELDLIVLISNMIYKRPYQSIHVPSTNMFVILAFVYHFMIHKDNLINVGRESVP